MKKRKSVAIWIAVLFALSLAVYPALGFSPRPDGSYEEVQELFNARCVLCHSCNNAPCQLKLSSYGGLQRGASKIEAIHPTRLQSIPPTRLGIDARSTGEWHEKGFFPVTGEESDLITTMINSGPIGSPADHVADSRTCPADAKAAGAFRSSHPEKLMPYGLPPLSQPEQQVLVSWVRQGGRPPSTKAHENLAPPLALAKSKWEEFLNQQDLEHRLVARYLYEHLFLASLHFSADSRRFYRIVRSRTPCGRALDEIATRRPSDDPKENFQYCLKPSDETVVEKMLLPYLLDQAKLDTIESLFFNAKEPWKASHWPEYRSTEKTNPFVLYQDIPVRSRYRFLLEDAQYHVATFIKGPVCYGRGAVSSIDEHFFVFFMKPASDLMATDPAFAKASEDLLVLPYMEGSDAPLFESRSLDEIWDAVTHRTGFPEKYVAARNAYVTLKDKHRSTAFKHGYQLSDLWNGDGANPNAALTVFRHFDHSYVLEGLRGGEASSYFVLDYGLFERLVYNLVVGYDVFGNVSHQLHTRLYMETLRREAEDNFLLFLPPPERVRLRTQWYQDELAKLEQKPFLDPRDTQFPTQINYHNASENDKELVAKIGNYFGVAVRGQYDGSPHSEYPPLEAMAEKPMRSSPFVNLFPDSSLILVEAAGHLQRAVTVIRDRAHNALGRFVLESTARVPDQDRLAIVDGLATSYPNLFFLVPAHRLPDFVQELRGADNRAAAQDFIKKWAVLKTDPNFWTISDQLHSWLSQTDPVNAGVLDYTRYGIWTEDRDWHE